MRGSKAVCTGIATTNNDDTLAFGVNRAANEIAFLHAVGQRKELHRLVNTDKLAPGNSEIACGRRATSQYNCIELFSKLVAGDINANVHIAAEFNAFGFELR
jgi:hypothetical protein